MLPPPNIVHKQNTFISGVAPFSALILTIIFVFLFLVRFYILEGFLLSKIYGETYTKLDDVARRGFVNHHIAGGTKILILILAVYPFIACVFGTARLHDSFAGSRHLVLGDVLVVCTQMLIAMYVFELFYRPKISPVSIGHHIGAILIGQVAIAISLRPLQEKDATIEFLLCTVWGAFDIISEFIPHVAIILYRVYSTHHHFLAVMFRCVCCATLCGTLCETILAMYLFGSLWSRWTLAFKVSTPILHILFSAAQLWGSYVLYRMSVKQRDLLMQAGKDNGSGPPNIVA